ncbi:MAG: DNA polymerase I [Stygiobacter sp. RIFOXYC12_FULL_38_8]|nr:MAG: DNA polymerase I [Stygiobacter sp. RIFOXYB2_FULL_37_11]OGV09913.1 MAG: DNA polymerase I [Stygiobacter sp. RIFOXYA2_FULL_38_8]OGV15234.1 MAG: DNA polymerase I [Stygiobacter sp. RIFOXYC2_FULL_38_25]OGV25114.1 MAG: DNA polymerase I [Stygiobacter sp. RIFOXYC12_FULL_38_8]OGV78972.1 MAG: DNA polymerase I [Stygiobacter sp. GWF2_38_21]
MSKFSSKKFVIIDAMALAYKGYYAFISRPLTNSKGEPTSAVFGFINQLFKIIEDTKPDYIAVAFDSKEKTFRHERYEYYKSSRQAMPEDMIPQIHRIKEVIDAFNIPIYILPGYEADDLIGTAVTEAAKLGFDCYAITPDKDYIQLVAENVRVVKPGKSTEEIVILDEDKVREEMGFEPKQMIDYLALVGDSSDDIPGVAGIGPKTAVPLIQEYKSLENIYKNIDKIEKQSIKNKLIENKENAFLSKELATIKIDTPFHMNFEEAIFEKPNFDKLIALFAELDFKSFPAKLKKIFVETVPTATEKKVAEVKPKEKEENAEAVPETVEVFDKTKVKYKLIITSKEAKELAKKLSEAELFVFDTETDGLDTFNIKLAGCAFALKPKEAFFVATDPSRESSSLFTTDLSDRIPVDEFCKIFKPIFESKRSKKVCQNGKYDIAVLRTYGIKVENFYFDTMLASYVIDPDQKHGMDDLSQKYLGYKPIPLIDLIGSKKTPDRIFEVEPERLADYSAEDADITFRLYELLNKELKKAGLEKLAYEVEFPLVKVLEDMEREGIRIDKNALNAFSNDLQILLDNYTREIYKHAGEEFNINSTQQLQRILFDKLQLPPTTKTKTGFSTDARSLEMLQGTHEIIDIISNYRQVAKLKSTYADSLPTLIKPQTGRIHTSYNQSLVSTGRLSSNDPNLQNIPIRTELGKEIRKAFVPRDKSHVILSADYSQIELRIMASICSDETLVAAFKNNEDIHRRTAALVFRVDPQEVTQDMRRKAKEVNFGILYGLGPFGLKTRLGITQQHAKEIIDNYFNSFKNVKLFMEESVKSAQKKGYSETLLGRRRFLKNINSSNRIMRQFEERVAVNMPIQGTAADMIKLAMIKIHDALTKKKFSSKMVLQVHDELVFDAHKDEIDDLQQLVKELMEGALPLQVPIIVETGIGDNWLDAH